MFSTSKHRKPKTAKTGRRSGQIQTVLAAYNAGARTIRQAGHIAFPGMGHKDAYALASGYTARLKRDGLVVWTGEFTKPSKTADGKGRRSERLYMPTMPLRQSRHA